MKLVVTLVVLLGLATGGLYAYARYRYDQIPKIHNSDVTAPSSGAPIDVLVAGTDSRAGFTASQQSAYGNTSNAGGNRSDATMIVRISPGTRQMAVLSIPYDTFVPLYGTNGSNKISDALNNGPKALVKTIEQNFGIPINDYVGVNFTGVIQLVQALGGVNVNFPYPSKDKMSGLNEPAGCQLLNGKAALALARSRYFYYYKNGAWQYDGSSGFGRIHRQHTVIRAIINKAKSSVLTNPIGLNSFVGSAVQNVAIDSKMSLAQMASLALDFRSFSGSALKTYTLPTQIVNNYGPYGDVLFPVKTLDNQVISQFLAIGNAPQTTTSTTAATQQPNSSGAASTPSLPPAVKGSIVQNRNRPSFDPTPC